MLAVKKLTRKLAELQVPKNAMSYSELLVALENIIIDKVATVPTARSRSNDTSTPMEIGMAAKGDGENASQEGDQRVVDFALKAVYQGTGKGKWSFGKGGTRKVAKVAKVDGRTHDRKAVARKEANGKRKVAREKPENVGRVARQDTLQPGADNEEDLQAWCLLEDSEMSSGKR